MTRKYIERYQRHKGTPPTKPMEAYDWLNLIILLTIAGLIIGFGLMQIF